MIGLFKKLHQKKKPLTLITHASLLIKKSNCKSKLMQRKEK